MILSFILFSSKLIWVSQSSSKEHMLIAVCKMGSCTRNQEIV